MAGIVCLVWGMSFEKAKFLGGFAVAIKMGIHNDDLLDFLHLGVKLKHW